MNTVTPLHSPESVYSQHFWNEVVTQLSIAGTIEKVAEIVTKAARQLVGADGITFVLKDGDLCYYFDENAISPLWKGKKFPAANCISGWAMINKQTVIIRDIYLDERIPHDAYRPTFVKSLCMTPVRKDNPIAAIGSYWSYEYTPTEEQLHSLQILANTTAIGLDNIQLRESLRNEFSNVSDLRAKNKELEAYIHSLVHDLRNPLTTFSGLIDLISMEVGGSFLKSKSWCHSAKRVVHRMSGQIDKMLALYRMNNSAISKTDLDLSVMFRELAGQLSNQYPKETDIEVADNLYALGDQTLIHIVMENLVSNACKYSSQVERRHLRFYMDKQNPYEKVFALKDNGIGFDPNKATELFKPLVRLDSSSTYSGTGLGLASSQRIISAHGGRMWAESIPGSGSTFYFSLPHPQESM